MSNMKHTICYTHFREEGTLPIKQNSRSFSSNLFAKNHNAQKQREQKNENPNYKTI